MTRIYTKLESLFSYKYIRAISRILILNGPFKTHFSLVKPVDQIWSENNMMTKILTRIKIVVKINLREF